MAAFVLGNNQCKLWPVPVKNLPKSSSQHCIVRWFGSVYSIYSLYCFSSIASSSIFQTQVFSLSVFLLSLCFRSFESQCEMSRQIKRERTRDHIELVRCTQNNIIQKSSPSQKPCISKTSTLAEKGKTLEFQWKSM